MTHEKQHHEKVSASFQGLAFLVTFTCLALLFSFRYNVFITHDPYIPLLANKKTDNPVTVGLHIFHFNKFDIATNEFIVEATLWFAFNPQHVSLDTLKKFTIFNGELLKVSEPVIIDHNDEKIAQFRIRAEFHTPLNYRFFPFDDHRVNIIIDNRFLPNNVTLQSGKQDITFDQLVYQPGWHIIGHEARTGIKEVILERHNKRYVDQQQQAIITFNCERTDPSIMINLLLILLLMLFLAMLTFSSNEDSVLIVTVGIVALIGYRTVMQGMAPPKVNYFIFSDYMYLFALVSVIITLVADIIGRQRSYSSTIKKYFITGIYASFVAACAITSFML